MENNHADQNTENMKVDTQVDTHLFSIEGPDGVHEGWFSKHSEFSLRCPGYQSRVGRRG